MAKEIKEHKRNLDGFPGDMMDKKTNIENAIKVANEAIEITRRRIDLMYAQFDVMNKNPRPINPTFEYEKTDEWLDVVRIANKLNRDMKIRELETEISSYNDRINEMKKLLEIDEEVKENE